MGFGQYVEYRLGKLLSHARGHDDALITRSSPFSNAPETLEVTSELGPSNSNFRIEHTGLGPEGRRNIFPRISWSVPASIKSETREYLVVVEDPDAPIPPRMLEAVHGIFYKIPASKTSISQEDLEPAKGDGAVVNEAQGGFRYGKILRPVPYVGARPTCGHGPHRYFVQVAALKEPIEITKPDAGATKAEIVKNIEGKVVAWGVWIGVSENQWH